MVSSSSPSPSSIAKAFLVILMLALVGSSSVFAARAGPAALVIDRFPVKPEMEDVNNQHRDRAKPTSGFRYRGMAFGFLPKGTPVPPSGPSPRHNSETNSTIEN